MAILISSELIVIDTVAIAVHVFISGESLDIAFTFPECFRISY